MPLGWRRRVLAAVATAAAALVLALVIGGRGCAPVDATPDGAARAFVSAARSGDKKAVWVLLGPDTKKRLEAAAVAATDNVGGKRRFGPLDVLDVGAGDTAWSPSGYRVLDHHGDAARVEVQGERGQKSVLSLVRVDGRWRVELGAAGTPPR
jgi:hypothetical protein